MLGSRFIGSPAFPSDSRWHLKHRIDVVVRRTAFMYRAAVNCCALTLQSRGAPVCPFVATFQPNWEAQWHFGNMTTYRVRLPGGYRLQRETGHV